MYIVTHLVISCKCKAWILYWVIVICWYRVSNLYRSTCSIPAVLPSHPRPDSPRSTRSAPWTQPHVRGLYTSSSPRSVRSAGNNSQLL